MFANDRNIYHLSKTTLIELNLPPGFWPHTNGAMTGIVVPTVAARHRHVVPSFWRPLLGW